MAKGVFAPRADLIDDSLWFEPPQTATATAALWRVLDIARQEPPRWMPIIALVGEQGAGKTALATRFTKATRRSVACDLLAKAAKGREGGVDGGEGAQDRAGLGRTHGAGARPLPDGAQPVRVDIGGGVRPPAGKRADGTPDDDAGDDPVSGQEPAPSH